MTRLWSDAIISSEILNYKGAKMERKQTLDRTYLRELIDASFDRAELAAVLGVSEGRLSRLLLGNSEFRYSEMLAVARALGLDSSEFERCFFSPEGSENPN